ncbi:HAD hydrolase-like protein [Streptomyces sp. NBC_01619]|uniref:HAD family hydrolase n=1 Tax=Streptomyces sp. NBC_01619 TaxID=2975901 RepID=UPI00224E159E|nr:HAD family hydrolase [Streptomyces sp. NBC_01619]MCX4510746.1 HAD hydrolase-like protein [Streptomyces sp. NBC_01619]
MPALIFDCDGVLADTERDGHLPAFNAAFEEFGLPVRWSDEEYAEKVKVGGGKERMRTLLTPDFVAAGLPTDPAALEEQVAAWHRRKTEIYTGIIRGGDIPPRPGVRRLAAEAYEAGWTLAVASTSAEVSVRIAVIAVVAVIGTPASEGGRIRACRGPTVRVRPSPRRSSAGTP